MLTIERLRRDAKAIPLVVRLGVIALVLSGLADAGLHMVAPAAPGSAAEHSPAELAAHFAGFVSMVVILLGVVTDGALRSSTTRRQRSGPESKGAS